MKKSVFDGGIWSGSGETCTRTRREHCGALGVAATASSTGFARANGATILLAAFSVLIGHGFAWVLADR